MSEKYKITSEEVLGKIFSVKNIKQKGGNKINATKFIRKFYDFKIRAMLITGQIKYYENVSRDFRIQLISYNNIDIDDWWDGVEVVMKKIGKYMYHHFRIGKWTYTSPFIDICWDQYLFCGGGSNMTQEEFDYNVELNREYKYKNLLNLPHLSRDRYLYEDNFSCKYAVKKWLKP